MLAASLAAAGFAGPRTVLEGEFGFLRVFCTEFDEADLTRSLGSEYVTLEHGAEALSVPRDGACRGQRGARSAGRARLFRRRCRGDHRHRHRAHDRAPQHPGAGRSDAGAVSIPFCVALALYREARDPESYDESALADPQIRALPRVRLVPEPDGGHGGMGSTVTLTLADGRRFEPATTAACCNRATSTTNSPA